MASVESDSSSPWEKVIRVFSNWRLARREDTTLASSSVLDSTSKWINALSYPPDVGASQLIIDGKIKLKSDGPVKKFTPTGLLFEDGSTLDADVIIFATGFVSSPFLHDSRIIHVIVIAAMAIRVAHALISSRTQICTTKFRRSGDLMTKASSTVCAAR